MHLLKSISDDLLLDPTYIEDLAKTAALRYRIFFINKKNGTLRQIHHPAKELKAIQRYLHETFLLNNTRVHNCAVAYSKNSSIKCHAEIHKNSQYLMRMDFRNFFSSISSADVYNFISQNGQSFIDGWSEVDTKLFTKLVCYKKSLTIGSVTSPMLTNAMCYDLDVRLFSLCSRLGVTYTRYADDMYFSTSAPNVLKLVQKQVKETVTELSIPKGLKINSKKTHHSSKKNRMAVTGMIITTDNKISVGRNKKREVRSLIHKWNTLDSESKNYLSGYLSYCKYVEPTFINALCNKYGAKIIDEVIQY